MTSADAVRVRARSLAEETPAWAPFVDLLVRAVAQATSGGFDAVRVEVDSAAASDGPRLRGAKIGLPRRTTTRWLRDLLPGEIARGKRVEPLEVLRASIEQDEPRLEAAAVVAGIDSGRLRAAAALAALPVLFACRRAVAGDGAGVIEGTSGSCPTCGAWPALAESRGLDRLRRLRCGRCGDDWPGTWLRCPYCEDADHRRQASLVPDEARDARRVDTCASCRGYVKTIPTVSALSSEVVPFEDLATVAFDVGAVERGYLRPPPRRTLTCEISLE